MKKLLLALTVITFSTTLFAAEPAIKSENTPPNPIHQKEKIPHDKDGPWLPKKEPNPHTLLDVTIKSDNPTEIIKNITTLIPESTAKQYSIHISVTELPNIEKPLPVSEKIK